MNFSTITFNNYYGTYYNTIFCYFLKKSFVVHNHFLAPIVAPPKASRFRLGGSGMERLAEGRKAGKSSVSF